MCMKYLYNISLTNLYKPQNIIIFMIFNKTLTYKVRVMKHLTKRKGVSLTTETLILLILAFLVLLALSIFFSKTYDPVEKETSDIVSSTKACSDYVRYDHDCRGGTGLVEKSGDRFTEIRDNLNKACEKFGQDIVSNNIQGDNIKKLKECCSIFCGD